MAQRPSIHRVRGSMLHVLGAQARRLHEDERDGKEEKEEEGRANASPPRPEATQQRRRDTQGTPED
jgi:hypothetical protein